MRARQKHTSMVIFRRFIIYLMDTSISDNIIFPSYLSKNTIDSIKKPFLKIVKNWQKIILARIRVFYFSWCLKSQNCLEMWFNSLNNILKMFMERKIKFKKILFKNFFFKNSWPAAPPYSSKLNAEILIVCLCFRRLLFC